MKTRFAIASLLFSATVIVAASAQASEVPITTTTPGSVELSPPSSAQYGPISNGISSGGASNVSGVLQPDEEIIFDYSFSNLEGAPIPPLTASIGNSTASTPATAFAGPSTSDTQTISMDGGLVTATASMNGLSSAETTITNDTGAPVSYSSLFFGRFSTGSLASDFKLTYNVFPLPIPTALLLFGTAMVGLFAASKAKRKDSAPLLAA